MNNKRVITLFFILIILSLAVYYRKKIPYLLVQQYSKIKNAPLYELIYSLNYENIEIDKIPQELKDKMYIFNFDKSFIKNDFNEKKFIKHIVDSIKHPKFNNTNINVLELLKTKVKYYFTAHTDIEWNLITNDGYQVWCLFENNNKNNAGNMFYLYNEYLYNKYKDDYYSICIKNNKVIVHKNCKYDLIKLNILEEFDKDWFIKNTKVYYLNINPGQCVVFDKRLCHMSDIRGKTRYAVNFRVTHGDVHFDNNTCGFVKDKRVIFKQ